MSAASYFQDVSDEHQPSANVSGRHQIRVIPLLPQPGISLFSNQESEFTMRGLGDGRLSRRKRASRPKVRSGCLTCKIRRVKCDERKPTCARCEKTDVECDGYTKEAVDPKRTAEQQQVILAAQQANRYLLPRPNGTGSRGPALASVDQPRINPSIIQINQSDVSYYDLFRHQLIRDLGGSCQADFWSRIVLNESTRDPCVRESILAIGAISQTIFFDVESSKRFGAAPLSALRPWGTPNSYSNGFIDRHHRAALLHYVKAVSIYRERIQESSTETSPRSVIIMTLLLIAFEFIQGNMKNVDSLMATGVRLLENKLTSIHGQQSDDESGEGPEYVSYEIQKGVPDDEMDDIEHLLPCLCLMSGFTHFFNSHHNSVLLMNSSPKLQLPTPGVTTITKLQALWGKFFTRAVVHVMRTVHDQLNYNPMNMSLAVQEQEKFVEYIGMWNDVLETYLGDTKLDDSARRTLDSIQIHRLLIHIVISCSLDRSEMMSDMFEAEFRELLDRVVRYLRDPRPIAKVTFTFSEGLTFPLALIIAKCRKHDLRMQGLHILNKLSWRENAWDGQALVVGMSGVVLLEERGMDEDGFIPPDSRWLWMSGKWDLKKRELIATYFRLTPGEDGTPFRAQLALDMDSLMYSCGLIGCAGRHDPFGSYGV